MCSWWLKWTHTLSLSSRFTQFLYKTTIWQPQLDASPSTHKMSEWLCVYWTCPPHTVNDTAISLIWIFDVCGCGRRRLLRLVSVRQHFLRAHSLFWRWRKFDSTETLSSIYYNTWTTRCRYIFHNKQLAIGMQIDGYSPDCQVFLEYLLWALYVRE